MSDVGAERSTFRGPKRSAVGVSYSITFNEAKFGSIWLSELVTDYRSYCSSLARTLWATDDRSSC